VSDSPVSQQLVLETPPPAALSTPAAVAPGRPPPLAKGLLLAGRFELVRPLGAGGLAEVWLAKDLKLGAEVAIKALHAHLAKDQPLCERFRRELAVTRGLDHPGIVKVYDLYDHAGRPFFSMELLRGEALSERLRRGPLAPAEARAVAREVALALQAAHRAGVVHRDLKPQNVFLEGAAGATAGVGEGAPSSVESGSLRVKLLDFGLARAAGQARMTAASTVLGTPGYIAPEVLEGAPADGRADLYALGAVLFELLTGKRAFASVDAWAVLEQKKRAPPALRPLCAAATDADERLVARALDPDPERRFLDASQLLRALEGGAVPEAPPSLPALTSGPHDVIVRRGFGFGARGRLKKALARLGLTWPGFSWGVKLSVTGEATLASGASRSTADALVAALQAEGVGAQVVPHAPQGKATRWLGAQRWLVPAAGALPAASFLVWGLTGLLHPAKHDPTVMLALVGAGLMGPVLGAVAMSLAGIVQGMARPAPLASEETPAPEVGRVRRWLRAARRKRSLLVGLGWAVAASTALTGMMLAFRLGDAGPHAPPVHFSWPLLWQSLQEGFFPSFLLWSFGGATAAAAILGSPDAATRRLEEGDPAVRRLAAGIERRLSLLRDRLAAAPQSERMVLEGLAAAAQELGRHAQALSTRAAALGDPALELGSPGSSDAAGTDAPTLPHGLEAGRDRALDRLLEIAASLDDALATVGVHAQGRAQAAVQVELERLREQVRAEEGVGRVAAEAGAVVEEAEAFKGKGRVR
jgi:tRNA A-37 threonylcarbamoyl transferase component Bud32